MSISKETIQQQASTLHQEIINLRRAIHANPELAFEENETAALVANKLIEMGIEIQTGIAKTGVIGLIKGKNPNKKVVALRADMDALPITETNDVPYKSKNIGKMHACGHDVHTSSLLGTAKILNNLKDQFEGTVKLLFQPSEEKLPGGASVMIEEGALENPTPQSILGQHVYPELEAGQFGFCEGEYMASTDEIYLQIIGQGGHAAIPQNVIDPILISAHIILALQQLTSRNANPFNSTVLSLGRIEGLGATNVIPERVSIQGTLRTMDEKWRKEVKEKLTRIATQTAEAMGAKCEITIIHGYPSLYNNPKLTDSVIQHAKTYLGAENVINLTKRMTGEDFAFYSQHMPACFYRMGTSNNTRGINSPIHTSTFDIDEKALEYSAGLMAWIAIQELQS